MPRGELVGDDACWKGEEARSAGVDGKEEGGLRLDFLFGNREAVFKDEGEDGDDEPIQEEILG